jgi:integrase
MTLCKHDNGIYYIWWVDESGRRRKTSTQRRRKAEALKFLQQFKAGQQAKKLRLRYTPLSQFAEEFQVYSQTVHSPATQNLVSLTFREFTKVIGNLPIQKVGVREIETFLSVKQTEASVWTSRKYYGVLASAFAVAVRWKYIATNPFREVDKPKGKESLPIYFSKEDFKRFINAIQNIDDRELYLAGVLTGMRQGELASLSWSSDIDFVRRVILVQNKIDFTTKSRRNRVIPMNSQLWNILALRKERTTCDLVFHKKGSRLTKDEISKTFKKYIRKLKCDDRLHFHSLRHTAATWMVQEGVPIFEVQKLLGHTSITVTQIYAHLATSQLHSAVEKLEIHLN